MKKETWKTILQIAISVLTALATTFLYKTKMISLAQGN